MSRSCITVLSTLSEAVASVVCEALVYRGRLLNASLEFAKPNFCEIRNVSFSLFLLYSELVPSPLIRITLDHPSPAIQIEKTRKTLSSFSLLLFTSTTSLRSPSHTEQLVDDGNTSQTSPHRSHRPRNRFLIIQPPELHFPRLRLLDLLLF